MNRYITLCISALALMMPLSGYAANLTALYMPGNAPVSVSFSARSQVASSSAYAIGIIFGDGSLIEMNKRPDCVGSACNGPDLFAVHSYAFPGTYHAKLVQFTGCPTDKSTDPVCAKQFIKVVSLLGTTDVVVK